MWYLGTMTCEWYDQISLEKFCMSNNYHNQKHQGIITLSFIELRFFTTIKTRNYKATDKVAT